MPKSMRRLGAMVQFATVAAALGACVTANAPPGTQDAPNTARTAFPYAADAYRDDAFATTVRVGLNGIYRRYIEPVGMDKLALNGIRGLATIDPTLKLEHDEHVIRLNLDEKPIARYPRPLEDSAEEWAGLTAALVQTGRERSPELQDADDERVFESLFDGMLSGLDIFSRYAGAEEARANRARRDGFGGIGIRFTKTQAGILITRVQEDGPAFASDLRPGDTIVRINGVPLEELSPRKVAMLLRGPVGSPLTLGVVRPDKEPGQPDRHISFNLARAHIVPQTVFESVEKDVLQLRVSGFNKKTASNLYDILRRHQKYMLSGSFKGIVLDLRDNPGGLLSQSINVADLFLDQGRIISTRGRHPDSDHDYNAGGDDLASGKPLVILIDADSASAAEIVAGALQDLGRAVVVGSSSYGKGTVQTVIRLPNDGEITLTWSRLVTPSGYALHGLGVLPAVCASKSGTTTDGRPKRLDDKIVLGPAETLGRREAIAAWRAAGQIFDGRRPRLRHACPAKAFPLGKDGDDLMLLAGRVLDDSELYRRAVRLSAPTNTASR